MEQGFCGARLAGGRSGLDSKPGSSSLQEIDHTVDEGIHERDAGEVEAGALFDVGRDLAEALGVFLQIVGQLILPMLDEHLHFLHLVGIEPDAAAAGAAVDDDAAVAAVIDGVGGVAALGTAQVSIGIGEFYARDLGRSSDGAAFVLAKTGLAGPRDVQQLAGIEPLAPAGIAGLDGDAFVDDRPKRALAGGALHGESVRDTKAGIKGRE